MSTILVSKSKLDHALFKIEKNLNADNFLRHPVVCVRHMFVKTMLKVCSFSNLSIQSTPIALVCICESGELCTSGAGIGLSVKRSVICCGWLNFILNHSLSDNIPMSILRAQDSFAACILSLPTQRSKGRFDGKVRAPNESHTRKRNIVTIITHFCEFIQLNAMDCKRQWFSCAFIHVGSPNCRIFGHWLCEVNTQ